MRRTGTVQLGAVRADFVRACCRVRPAGLRGVQRAGIYFGDAAAPETNASLDAAPAVDVLLDAARQTWQRCILPYGQ